jgi:sugar phosphate isomerase/epimerase
LKLACALHFSGFPIKHSKAARLAAAAGFDALEISPWIPSVINRAGVSELKASLKRNHIAFSGFTAIYPPQMVLASRSPAARKRSILHTNHLIELAQQLGGRTLVWGSPRSRNIPSDVPLKRGHTWLVQLLKTSGSLADEKGVKIAIEPINRFESTIIHTTREALSLARQVDRDSVGIVYDVFHVSLEEDSFTAPILLARKRLAAVHVSDCNRRIPGKGHIDFRPIFRALNSIGYDGYVTLEATLSRDIKKDLLAARKHLESLIE